MDSNNPFYAPPAFPDLSPQIMQFGEMGIRNDQLAAQRALEIQKMNNEKQYQDTMACRGEMPMRGHRASAATLPQGQPWNLDQFDTFKNMA